MRTSFLLACLMAPSLAVAEPFEGLYTGPLTGEKARVAQRYVVSGPNGLWVFDPTSVSLVPRAQLAFTPGANGKPWQLERGRQKLTQLADPFLARILAALRGRRVFNLVALETGKPGQDTLTIQDGVFLRFEWAALKRGPACRAGALVFDPSWNGERPIDPAPKQPAAGALAVRTFLALELDSEVDCPSSFDKTKPNRTKGLMGGAKVYARADGRIEGIQLVAYMESMLYAPADASPEAIRAMLKEVAEEIGRQAE